MRGPCMLHFIPLDLIYDYSMTQKRTNDFVCRYTPRLQATDALKKNQVSQPESGIALRGLQ
jgi:hypothetical protein